MQRKLLLFGFMFIGWTVAYSQCFMIKTDLGNGNYQFEYPGAPPQSNLHWDFGDGGSMGGNAVQHTFASGFYFISLTSIDTSINDTCQAIDSVFIQSAPSCFFNGSQISSNEFNFEGHNFDSLGNHSFDFGDGNGTGFTGSNFANHTYSDTGSYMVVFTTISSVGDTCVSQDLFFVTSLPSGLTCDFGHTSVGPGGFDFFANTDSNAIVDWNFGDGSFGSGHFTNHVYSASGTYTVMLTVYDPTTNDTCYTYDTIVVNLSAPACYFDVTPVFSNEFSFEGHNFDPSGMHSFSFGDGNSTSFDSTNFAYHEYTDTGNYMVVFTTISSTGDTCTSQDLVSVTFVPTPLTCVFSFTDLGNGSFDFMTTADSTMFIDWNFDDGSFGSGNMFNHTYANSGTYIVQMTVYDPTTNDTCYVYDTVVVNLSASLSCNFSHVSVGPGGFDFFANTDSSAIVDWNFGDGSFGSGHTVNHVYANSGSYAVDMTVYSANDTCYYTDSVFVNIAPTAACFMNTTNYGGGNFYFEGHNFDPNHYLSWDFGDGTFDSISANVSHFYSPGTYIVAFKVIDPTSGTQVCISLDTITVTQATPITCDFGLYFLGQNTYQFDAYVDPASTIDWNFGDGTTSNAPNPIHTFTPGAYAVTLISYNPTTNDTCIVTDSVFVNGTPPVGLSCFYSIDMYNINRASLDFAPIGDIASIASVTWSFGDGTTSTNISDVHTYTASGSYLVCLDVIMTNGDSCSYCDSVYIAPPVAPTSCFAQFSYYTNDLIVDFIDMSSSNAVSFWWDFGDGNTSTVEYPRNVYAQGGLYNVCLVMTDASGCMDTVCQQVFVYDSGVVSNNPNCQAVFAFTQDTLGNLTVVNVSTGDSTLIYTWDFGDGSTSNNYGPAHIYTQVGMYELCLTITDPLSGCTSSFCDTIGVDTTGLIIPRTSGFSINVITPAELTQGESNTTSVIENEDVSFEAAYPNPTNDVINLVLNSKVNEDITINIYSVTGNLIKSSYSNINTGVNLLEVNMRDLSNGTYIIEATNGSNFKVMTRAIKH